MKNRAITVEALAAIAAGDIAGCSASKPEGSTQPAARWKATAAGS